MPMEQPVPRFFQVLIAAATVLLAAVIYPVVTELVVAAVLASSLWPLQKWLAARLRGRRGVSAGVITFLVIILLLGPIATLVTFVVRDGSDAVRWVSETARGPRVTEILGWLPEGARTFVEDGIDRLPKDLGEAVGQVGATGGKTAVTKGARFALHTVFMLIALFFMLVRGDEFVGWVDGVSPLRRGHTRELLTGFKRVSFMVIVSTVITAGVQAVAALIGYLIAGVPHPIFFMLVTFFVAFVPAIGATSVCLAAALLLFVTGHPYKAIFLAAWGLAVVGVVDNVVKPLLIKRGMELHGVVVFFSLVGGLATFGPIGLLIGPLAVAFFLALARMYHRDFSPAETRVPPVPGLPGREGGAPPQAEEPPKSEEPQKPEEPPKPDGLS